MSHKSKPYKRSRSNRKYDFLRFRNVNIGIIIRRAKFERLRSSFRYVDHCLFNVMYYRKNKINVHFTIEEEFLSYTNLR